MCKGFSLLSFVFTVLHDGVSGKKLNIRDECESTHKSGTNDLNNGLVILEKAGISGCLGREKTHFSIAQDAVKSSARDETVRGVVPLRVELGVRRSPLPTHDSMKLAEGHRTLRPLHFGTAVWIFPHFKSSPHAITCQELCI